MNIKNIFELLPNRPTNKQLEQIDNIILFILNIARKKVEGPRRNIPFLNEMERRQSTKMY